MALRDLLIRLKIIADTKPLENANEHLENAKTKARGLDAILGDLRASFNTLGALFAAREIAGFVKQTLDAAGAINDQSLALGISTDALQTWQAFLGQSGATTEDLAGTFRILSGNMQQVAAAAKGPAAEAFKKLGIETKNPDGTLRDLSEVLLETGGALATLKNPTERAALATDTLGRGAAKLLPAFEGGTEAARANMAAIREVAIAYDSEFVQSADRVGDKLGLLRLRFLAIRNQVVAFILPAIEFLSDKFDRLGAAIKKQITDTSALRVVFLSLGGVALRGLIAHFGGFVGMLAKTGAFLRAAAGFALRFILPILILDDVITGLQGGDSVFRDILNALFGEQDAGQLIADINELFASAIPAFGEALKVVIPIARDLFEGIGAFIKLFVVAPLKGLSDLFGMIFADTDAEKDQYFAAFLQDTQDLTNTLDAVFAELGAAISQPFIDAFTFVRDFVARTWREIGEFFQLTVLDPIKAGLAAIDQFWRDLGDSIVASITGAFDRVKALAASALDALNPFSSGPSMPAVANPGAGRGGSLTDNRTVTVNVGPNATPAATGRAVANAVSSTLGRDTRANLAAVGG